MRRKFPTEKNFANILNLYLHYWGSMVGLVGLSLLYLVLSLALGLFISTMANTQVTAMLISGMVLMLPIIMLSGMLFPVENMPGIL